MTATQTAEAAEFRQKVTNPGFWTPGMLAHVLAGGVHHVFRETVEVDKHETPTPETKNRFKLTMSNGDSLWVTVTEDK